jgi:hypothetical protein
MHTFTPSPTLVYPIKPQIKIGHNEPHPHRRHNHPGLAAASRLDPESGMNLREKQVYDNFLSAIDTIIRQKPDVLVHAGDLFDTVKPKTRATQPCSKHSTISTRRESPHKHNIPDRENEYIFYSIEYILYSF